MSMGYFCLVIAYLHLQGALTVTQEKKVSHGQQLLWNKKPIEIVGVDHVVEKVGYSNKTNVPQKPQTKNKYVGVRLSEYIGDMIKSQQSLLEKMINFNMGGMDIIEAVEKLPKETASEILTEQLPKTERASELPHEQKMEIASELLTEQLPKMMHARNNEKPAGTEMLENVLGSEQSLNGLKDAVGFIESLPPDFEQNLLDPNYKEQEMKSFPDYMYVNMEENLLLGKKHQDPEIKPLESESDTLNKVKQNSKFSDSRDSSHSPKEKTINEIANHDISTLDSAAQTTTELSTSQGSEQVNQFGFAISHPDKNALKRLEETFPLVYQTIDTIPNTNEHSSTALSTHEYGQVQITKSGNQEQALHISESLTENTETHASTANHAQASQSTNMENTIIHSHSSISLKGQVAAENVDKTPVVKVDTTLTNNEKQSVASPNDGKLFVHQHNVNEHSEGRTSPTKTFSHPNSEASSLSELSMGLSANKVQVEIPLELDSVKSPIDVDKTLDKSVPSTNENLLPLENSQNSKLQTSDSLIMPPNEPKFGSTHARFSMKSHQAKRKTAALKKSKTNTVIVEQNIVPHQDISPEIIHGITEASSQNVQSVIPVEIGPKKHGAMTQNTAHTIAAHEIHMNPNENHVHTKHTHIMPLNTDTKQAHEKLVTAGAAFTTADHPQQITSNPNTGNTAAKRTQEMSVSPNTGHTTAKRTQEMSVSPNTGHTTAKRTQEMSVSPNTGHTTAKRTQEMSVSPNTGHTTAKRTQEMSLSPNTGHTTAKRTQEMSVSPNTASGHTYHITVNPNSVEGVVKNKHEMLLNQNAGYSTVARSQEMSLNSNTGHTTLVHAGEVSANPKSGNIALAHGREVPVKSDTSYTSVADKMSVNQKPQYTAAAHPREMSVNPNQQYTAAVHPGEMSVNPNQQYTAAVHPREMLVNPNQQYTVAVHPHEMPVNPNQQYTAAVHPGEILVNPKPYQTTAVDTHEASVNPHSGFISRGGHAGQISVNPNSESNSKIKMSVNPDTGFTVAANTQEMSMNQHTGNPVMERTNKVSVNPNTAAGNTRQVTQNPNTNQIAVVHPQDISVNQNIGSDATKHTKASLLSHSLSTGTDKTHDSYDKTKFTAYIPTPPKRLNLDHQSYESVETNLPNTKQNNLHSENHFLDGRFLGNIHEPQNAFVENAQSFIFKGTNGENNKSSVGKTVTAITHTIGIDKVTSAREDPLLIEQNPAFSKETFGTHLLHRDTKRYDSPNILGERNRNSEIMSNLNNQIEEKTSTISLTVPENKGEVLSAKLSNKVKNRISFSYKKKTAERGVQSGTNENSKNAKHTGVVMKTGSVVLKGKTEAGTVSTHKQVHDANSMATRTNTYHGSGKGEFFGKLRQLSKIDIDVTKGPLFTDSITENIKQENKPTETIVSHNEANTPMIGGSISGTVSGAVASYGPQGAESGFSHSTKPHVPVIDLSYDQNNILSSSTNPRAKALATGSTGSFSNDAMISADNALVQEKYSSSSQKMSPYGNQFNSLKGHVQSISSQSATNHLNIEASNSQFEMNISPSGISQNVKVDSHKDTNFDLSKKGKRNVSIDLLKPAQKEIQLGEKHQMDEILSTHRKGQDKNSGEANPKEQKLIQTSEYISNSVTQKDKLGGIQKPATYNAKSRNTAYSDKSLSVDSIKVTDISDRMVDTNAKYSTEPQKLGGDISLNGNVKVRVKQSPMEKIKNSVSESLESLSVSKTSNRASISESKDKKTLVNTGPTSYEKKQKADKKENKSKFTRHIKSTSKGPSNKSIQGKGKISKLSLHSGGKMNSTISGTKRKTVRKYTSSTRKHIPNFLSLPRSRKAKSLLVAVLSGLKKRGLKIRNFAALKKIVSAIKILAARLQARKKLRPVITKPIVYTHYLDDDDDNDTNEIDDNDDIPTHPNNV